MSGTLGHYHLPPHPEKVRIYNKHVKMSAEPIDFSICKTSLGEGGLCITTLAENLLMLIYITYCFKVKANPASKVIKVNPS